MKRILFKEQFATTTANYKAGKTYDMDDHTAAIFVAAKLAIYADEKPTEKSKENMTRKSGRKAEAI